jgi:hypothetical protein
MEKPDRRELAAGALVFLLILAAWSLRLSWSGGKWAPWESALRTVLYFVLFSVWGLSVKRRILHPAIRRQLLATALLILLWMALRTVKFHVPLSETARRYLWYGYYVPMILLPLMGFFTAVCLGKPDGDRIPPRLRLLYLPAGLLILLIFSNDLHQLAFSFLSGTVWSDHHVRREIVYYLAAVWILSGEVGSLLILLHKAHVPRSRTVLWLPFLPLMFGGAYAVLYDLRADFLLRYFGDMSTVFCLVTALTWESCIQCGLIRSNTRYGVLFRCSTAAAQIVRPDYSVYLSSDAARPLPAETLRKTEFGSLQEGGMRLSSAPIRGGRVVWQEDVSALTGLLRQLGDVNESLQEKNLMLSEEYKTRRRLRRLAEQNRLYNKMQALTEKRLRELSGLLDRLEAVSGPAEEGPILLRIAVIGAYLKRRSNLIFISEDQKELPAQELAHCLRESAQNLTLFGILCDFRVELTGLLLFWSVLRLYEVFQTVLESSLDGLRAIYVSVSEADGRPLLALRLSGGRPPDAAEIPGLSAEAEDEDEWLLRYRLPEGDEAK